MPEERDREKRRAQAVLNPDKYKDYLLDDLDYQWWKEEGEALSKKK